MAKLKTIEWFLRVFILLFVWSIINTFLALFHSNSLSKETITSSRNCLHFSFSIVECNFFRIRYISMKSRYSHIKPFQHTRLLFIMAFVWHYVIVFIAVCHFLFIISSSIFSFFDWRIMPKKPNNNQYFFLTEFQPFNWSVFFPSKKRNNLIASSLYHFVVWSTFIRKFSGFSFHVNFFLNVHFYSIRLDIL